MTWMAPDRMRWMMSWTSSSEVSERLTSIRVTSRSSSLWPGLPGAVFIWLPGSASSHYQAMFGVASSTMKAAGPGAEVLEKAACERFQNPLGSPGSELWLAGSRRPRTLSRSEVFQGLPGAQTAQAGTVRGHVAAHLRWVGPGP